MRKYLPLKVAIPKILPILALLIVLPAQSSAQSCDIYKESGGLVVMETEAVPVAGSWSLQNGISGATGTGYYEWKTGNSSGGIDGSGQGILSYDFEITQAGTYRFLFRTNAPHTTEHNDAWIRFTNTDVEARKSNGGSVIDLGQNTWFKVYQNKGADSWNFDAFTVDNNRHEIFALIDSPGVYTMEMSGRSTMFKVDRFVLFDDRVSEASASDINNPESGCSSLPVELTSFDGLVNGDEVTLRWETASETNNAGFDIEFAPQGEDFSKIGFVPGGGTSNEALTYHFTHAVAAFQGQVVSYRLRQVDFDGAFEYSDVVSLVLSASETTLLHPAYPNPFNPSTTIAFTLPAESQVQLSVYDGAGRLVQTLFDGILPAGHHTSAFEVNSDVASGMYLYRLVTPARTLSGTVMLLK